VVRSAKVAMMLFSSFPMVTMLWLRVWASTGRRRDARSSRGSHGDLLVGFVGVGRPASALATARDDAWANAVARGRSLTCD